MMNTTFSLEEIRAYVILFEIGLKNPVKTKFAIRPRDMWRPNSPGDMGDQTHH